MSEIQFEFFLQVQFLWKTVRCSKHLASCRPDRRRKALKVPVISVQTLTKFGTCRQDLMQISNTKFRENSLWRLSSCCMPTDWQTLQTEYPYFLQLTNANVPDGTLFIKQYTYNPTCFVLPTIFSEYTRWFKYDRDWLCVNKSQFVPVIFEPPCIIVTEAFKDLYMLKDIKHTYIKAILNIRHTCEYIGSG